MDSNATRLFDMLSAGDIALTVNGTDLGTVKVLNVTRTTLETYPPLERVTVQLQFPRASLPIDDLPDVG